LTGFQSAIEKLTDPHARLLFHLTFNRIANHAQAFGLQQDQIDTLKTSTTSTSTTVIEGGGSPVPPPSSGILSTNNQSGVISYTTQSGDNGALLILSDASSITVTLAASTPPYGIIITNLGAGLATLTPALGTISYPANPSAASMPLPGGQFAIVAFDGTNWFAAIDVLPQTIVPVAGEYLTGYDASTGLFSQSTPAGISATIVTAALTTLGTQGSMTFVDGRLTAQTPAT
jgi:hypothetical protein